MTPPEISTSDLIDRYDALLLDAYGVLVHSNGAFPGAETFLERLEEADTDFFVVTNDASRLPRTAARKYRRHGLYVDPEKVLTSGMLLESHFQERDLVGSRCLVLGTEDSAEYVERAGGELVDVQALLQKGGADLPIDALVIGDESGFPFLPVMDAVLTMLIRRLDADDPVELIVPNPDLIYQRNETSYGFASGTVAGMLEDVLAERFPNRDVTFDRLGKPHPPIYEEAMRQAGTDNIAMVGDQLATDIRGANACGLDSVLVTGGLTNVDEALESSEVQPDYILRGLT